MHLSDREICQLRQVELEILKAFMYACEKLHLHYFVVQGTLLGAVRHHGFIPWDDDIDVGMLREDYEVFMAKGKNFLPEYYFIQNHDTDPDYPQGFAKIRDTRTAFVETTCRYLHMNHGIYMDIFPFDYYPDGFLKKTQLEIQKLLLRYRIRSCLYVPADKVPTLANAVRSILKLAARIRYPSLQDAIQKQCALYSYTEKSRKRANYGSPWGKREYIPAEWVEKTTELDFEGLRVNAPLYYREYLEHVYGNYMELPPLKKRKPHHYISYLSFKEPFCMESCRHIEEKTEKA